MATYEIDLEMTSLFPRMTEADFSALRASIRQRGFLAECPILLWRESADQELRVIDGKHRQAACELEAAEPVYRELPICTRADALAIVAALNADRRMLDASQAAMVRARLERMGVAANLQTPGGLAVSDRTTAYAKNVLDSGHGELIAAVEAGTVKVSDAAALTRTEDVDPGEALALVKDGEHRTLASAARALKPTPPAAAAEAAAAPVYRRVVLELDGSTGGLALALELTPEQMGAVVATLRRQGALDTDPMCSEAGCERKATNSLDQPNAIRRPICAECARQYPPETGFQVGRLDRAVSAFNPYV